MLRTAIKTGGIAAVIPCYNEAQFIQDVVRRTQPFVSTIIVADDKSTDDTLKLLPDDVLQVRNYDNLRGAGANTRRGIELALLTEPEVIVTLDGDGQHCPEDIQSVLRPILDNAADLVVGSRFSANRQMPKYRMLGIKVITWLYNIGNQDKISDAQCCLRAFRVDVLRHILIKESGFGFSTEMLIKARQSGVRITEVPIQCVYHQDYKNNSTLNPVIHGIKVAIKTIRWRLWEHFGTMNGFKKIIYYIFKKAIKPFRTWGLSTRTPVRKIYNQFARLIIPEVDRVIDINGYKMRVKIGKERDAAGLGQILIYDHIYDRVGTSIFNAFIKDGMSVVDVGANVGYYTLLAAKLVGNSGKVYSFEPERHNFNDMQGNIELNGYSNVELYQKAVGRTNGLAQLHVSNVSSGRHSIVYNRGVHTEKVTVPLVKLDTALNGYPVDFIKIDTEGADLAVIDGAKRIIEANYSLLVMMEFYPEGLRVDRWTPEAAYKHIKDLGFNFIYLLNEWNKSLDLVPYEQITKYIRRHGQGCNFLCSKLEINNKLEVK